MSIEGRGSVEGYDVGYGGGGESMKMFKQRVRVEQELLLNKWMVVCPRPFIP